MIQVPVEGGHCGGDLTIRLKQKETKPDFSQENSQKFYLSASFIDCDHKVAPITEGWSVILSYYLVMKKPIIVSPRGMNLPTFISSRETVEEILSPMLSPVEDCDTEMLVIPLRNDYARTPLKYSNLRGTDKLMANLLQSTNSLEIRLATVVKIQIGYAFDEQRMNTDRIEDDGFPNSPPEMQSEEFIISKNPRCFAQVDAERCFIEEFFFLNGEEDENGEESFPITWSSDYIDLENVASIEDIFPPGCPPDKEEYDRYTKMGDWDGDLKQCWFKPVLIFKPKDSLAVKCRKNITNEILKLQRKVSEARASKEDNLRELRKIVNYVARVEIYELYGRQDVGQQEVVENLKNIFFICNSLEAKEDGIFLICFYAQYEALKWPDLITQFGKFVSFAGWKDCCREIFFGFIFKNKQKSEKVALMIQLVDELLKEDSAIRNEAAIDVYRKLLNFIFPSPKILSNELFASKVDNTSNLPRDSLEQFLQVIFILQHRQLLDKEEQSVIPMAVAYLLAKPIGECANPHLFVLNLCSWPLFTSLSFEKLTSELQNLLEVLCCNFLALNVQRIRAIYVVYWMKTFLFVGGSTKLQQLVDKICSRRPPAPFELSSKKVHDVIRNLLAVKELQTDLKLLQVKKHLESHQKVLLKQFKSEVHHYLSYLKSACFSVDHGPVAAPITAFINANLKQTLQTRLEQLGRVVDLFVINPLDRTKLTKEETEKEFLSVCDLIGVCCKLGSKEEAQRVLTFYSSASGDISLNYWLRPEMLSVLADSIASFGLSIWSIIINLQFEWQFCRNSERLALEILLVNELLKRNSPEFNNAAVEIFRTFCIDVNFPYCVRDNTEINKYLSSLNEKHRQVFFQVFLLMNHRGLLFYLRRDYLTEVIMRHLESAPIDSLHPFIDLLFSDLATLTSSLPFDQLSSRCQDLLRNFCSRFVEYIRFSLPLVTTKDLLNWIRLFVYIKSPHHIKWLVRNLCFNTAAEERSNSSLKKLLAREEFQTDTRFNVFREHAVLIEWKKQRQQESFKKLFKLRREPAEPAVYWKRKLAIEDSADGVIPKRKKNYTQL